MSALRTCVRSRVLRAGLEQIEAYGFYPSGPVEKGRPSMIRITGIRIRIPHDEAKLYRVIRRQARGLKPVSYRIVRRSVDARKKPELHYVYTIDAEFCDEEKLLRMKGSRWERVHDVIYSFPPCHADRTGPGYKSPVVVGFGPAGIFASLLLARSGLCPVVLERGDQVELRQKKVDRFFREGVLDPDSNIQFGEGGAGTFSDGKLNTMVKDRSGRNRFVLSEFVKHGAPAEILYEAKPHIGTDILKKVVASIREEVTGLGGQIHFRAKLTGIKETGGRLCGIFYEEHGIETFLDTDTLILAIGHSARDTFSILYDQGIEMTAKAFAMGIRVEHPAGMIDRSMYGEDYPGELPAASYKLTHQCRDGRGIYSFCMCPGGYVVNSSSEPGHLCVNGMSYSGRDGANSNSAIITTVTPEDYPSSHPLAGMEFQRIWEKAAYDLCRGSIPVQLYEDFREDQTSVALGSFEPQIKGRWAFANLRRCLPDYICRDILEGMEAFGKKISGFDRPDTIFSGVETRTSSPVRILRDETFQSNLKGFFPCGEGAGYAGGITSAAMDGIRVAEAVVGYLSDRLS